MRGSRVIRGDQDCNDNTGINERQGNRRDRSDNHRSNRSRDASGDRAKTGIQAGTLETMIVMYQGLVLIDQIRTLIEIDRSQEEGQGDRSSADFGM